MPWNWPLNQIVCKVAPAFAAGCTMVLKPSETAPLNAVIWSEVMRAAGVPVGVYNMVQGAGDVVDAAMSVHPDIDMMSFTGSTLNTERRRDNIVRMPIGFSDACDEFFEGRVNPV